MVTKKATTAKKSAVKKITVSDDDIRRRAEEIYAERLARGEHGNHLDDWLKAEQELKKAR
jgi:uncharacterized membrane protein